MHTDKPGSSHHAPSRRQFVRGALGAAILTAASLGAISVAHADNVTLSYALWDEAQAPAMQKIIDEFHKAHPEIDVKIQLTPWSDY